MPSNVKQTKQGAELDMTSYKLFGQSLKDQILKDVKATQMFAGFNLPDKLFITRDQFNSIENDLDRMEDTKQRLYNSGRGVMEVTVYE